MTKKKVKKQEPLWKGPEVDGITQSLLSRFVQCRERFRLLVVEGLQPADTFNHRIEYGNMWHVCEEDYASKDNTYYWEDALTDYCCGVASKYKEQGEQVNHWYMVCKTQFPIYIKYWRKHKDTLQREPLLQEHTFRVPYTLPSGRGVLLRGKWDSVDLIGKGKNARVYLQENKTKGDVNEQQLKRQLQFDLQTMFYLVALEIELDIEKQGGFPKGRLGGIRYNVVRRPLSGGKGSIRQHKPTKTNPRGESSKEFYERLGGIIKAEPETYFMRWKVEVTPGDLSQFKREFLNPILESLCDWWKWIETHDPFGSSDNSVHWRTPYGMYNVLAEGGSTELDEYLATGSTLGLEKAETLFRELE